jgi:intein/homing endonuclease
MVSQRQNLFSRLTRLFRAGPIVKRKIKGMDSSNVRSSALDVFRKSTATVYGNSLNSYGQYDRLCVFSHTKIPVPGPERFVEIQDLGKRYPNGEKFIVYAYDHEKKCIVPAWAHHPRCSGIKDTVKVTFDDGSELICTPDHPCLMRNGTYRNAQDLTPGDSMMPFYRKEFQGRSSKDGKKFYGYESVLTFNRDAWNGWQSEHRLIAEWFYGREQKKNEHCHHRDFNSKNNDPTNLEFMDAQEHLSLHGKKAMEQWKDPEIRQKMIDGLKEAWDNNPERKEKLIEFNKTEETREKRREFLLENNPAKDKEVRKKMSEAAKNRKGINYKNLLGKENLKIAFSKDPKISTRKACKEIGVHITTFTKYIQNQGYKNWTDFKEKELSQPNNHKVISVEPYGEQEVWDLTVDGYENFATDTIVVHNSRYADFSEMEYCVSGDTKIGTPNGYRTIKELSDEYGLNKEFIVYSWDYKLGVMRQVWAKQARKTRRDHAWKLTFNNEKSLTATSNHRIMTQNGIYAKVEDLSVGDFIKNVNKIEKLDWEPDRYENRCEHKIPDEDFVRIASQDDSDDLLGTKDFLDQLADFGFYSGEPKLDLAWFRRYYNFEKYKNDKNHGVSEIEWEDGLEIISIEYVGEIDLYDFTVNGYKNFATDTVISHNTPEIASALDIYADETVAKDDKGRSLHIYSENPKIKRLLEELFYDTLNFEFAGRSWVRNLGKYGDFFILNDVSPKFGVINAHPIPVNEIEREEGFDPNNPFAVRFRWVTEGNQVLENWQVTHFRLLGNDTFLPYGASVLEPARRIWRQLIMAEDAMLVYRVIRSPERRVFYIDVGNAPPNDVPHIIENARATLKSQEVVDKQAGRVDLRYNPWCTSMHTLIPLLDGRSLTLEQIIKEWEGGNKDLWTYSVDLENKKLAAGKVTWAGITKKNAEIVRVHLDNNKWIDATPEHRFMLRDGTYREASKLEVNDKLMPLYTYEKEKKTAHGSYRTYEEVYDPYIGFPRATHQVVMKSLYSKNELKNKVIHHNAKNKNGFDSKNNSPNNLELMTWDDHVGLHKDNIIKYNKSLAGRENSRNNMKKLWAEGKISGVTAKNLWKDKDIRKKRVDKLTLSIDKEKFISCALRIMENLGNGLSTKESDFREELNKDKEFSEHILKNNKDFKNGRGDLSNRATLQKFLKKFGFEKAFTDFKRYWLDSRYELVNQKSNKSIYRNHKVIRIEKLEESEDVGCITVEKYHNFAVAGDIRCYSEEELVNFKATKSGVFIHNSVDIDYFLPVRGTETGTKIDTLPGGANTTAIDDVEYIQRKLFAALKVPKAYLGFDEALTSKANLAQEDIRFARTIQQIQQVIISELNKIAAIHLAAHGYDGEDLIDFHLSLSNPSTMAQQQKLELMRIKFEIAGTRPEGLLTDRFIYKEVFGLTDDQIEEIEEDQIKELIRKARMEQMGAEGPGGGEGGLGGGGGGGGGLGGLGGGLEGDLGGEEDLEEPEGEGGEEAELGGGEEDLFAGEKRSGLLITDDEDETIEVEIDEAEDYTPVHQQNQLSRYRHNNLRPSRRKTKGNPGNKFNATASTLNADDPHLKDPFGKRTFSAVKGVGHGGRIKYFERYMRAIEKSETARTRLSNDLKHTLDSIPKSITIDKGNVPKKSNLITESDKKEDE